MRTFAGMIKDQSPQFNREVVEGLTYHRLKFALEYLDQFIRYSCESKTQTHLRYLGYKQLTPQEEMRTIFNKTSKVTYDIAENDIYLVEYYFQYGDNPEVMKHQFYIPFANKGNVIHFSGNRFLVMPTLADKVISVGDNGIFINIITAKYNFARFLYSVMVDDRYQSVTVIHTELYKNPSKKVPDTTKANTTVIHYLLANYGYAKTMEMLLGFVPQPVYDYDGGDKVIIRSSGVAPRGYIQDKSLYQPSNIKFLVDTDRYNEKVRYVLGNVLYVIDHFPQAISISDLDNVQIWRRLLAEIIHSGNHGLAYLHEKISTHYNDLNSSFDTNTIRKLSDVGVTSKTLMELLVVIFDKYNTWIMQADTRSLYHRKTLEVESFVLKDLTSAITRIVLDINKEELRINGNKLDDKAVEKIFKSFFKTRIIYMLKKESHYVTSVEYSGDHLYPKNTSMINEQESNPVNIRNAEATVSEKKKLVASMATVGTPLGMSKTNPTPLARVNLYIMLDPETGTVLPHPLWDPIIQHTDALLENIAPSDSVVLPTSDNDDSALDDDETYDDDEIGQENEADATIDLD